MKRPRILLAEDYRLLREAFTQLLASKYEVVGAVADGRALLTAARELRPDVVVLDIAMPLLNGLDAAHQLKQSQPTIKIIFLTVSEDADLATRAFQVGASAYLLKNSAATELFLAIQEALQGRTYVTPQVADGVIGTLQQRPESEQKTDLLTPRQREVLQLLAEGHSMKAIARVLHITARTVAFHKYSMMEQLGIQSNAGLVQLAIKHHLVSVEP